MRKSIVSVLLVIGIAAVGYAQETPAEVKRFLDNYTKDSTAEWGPLEYKKRGIIPASVQIKDIKLRVLQVYNFKDVSINEYPDTVALNEIIVPNGFWRVLVMGHNKPLYELWLDNENGKPKFVRATTPEPIGSDFKSDIWEPLLKAYPESTGINPVLVVSRGAGFGREHTFLYFKQKGPRKVHYLKPTWKDDPLDSLFDTSIETLDDSRKLVGHWKRHGFNNNRGRNRQENINNVNNVGDIKQKEGSFPAFIDGSINLKEHDTNDVFPAGGKQ